jgi:hypothetical protein
VLASGDCEADSADFGKISNLFDITSKLAR